MTGAARAGGGSNGPPHPPAAHGPRAARRWPLPVRAALALAVVVALNAANVRFVCSPLYLRLAYGPLRPAGAALAGPPDWVAAAAEATTEYVSARAGREAVALLDDDGERALFTDAELDHLADVRRVIATLFGLGIAAAAAILLALAVDASPGRWRARAALMRGGQLAAGLTLVVGVLVAVAWNTLFTAFHTLLFPPGTWQFPSDSRLIQLFPDWFWQSAAAVLAGLLLVEGLLISRLAGRGRRAG